ncbi:hypothetical protein [Acidovorax radicis]|jgi:hypothetical protein|uniref:hypothetical protein n=1 Tax=Acidovorax radicis TaxID=758826 RepID=UPI001CF977F2|nr:hypothetical protein [Acidovorax radicis]UCV01628.1 hypothetical protein KI609_04795 [Acidovorax radicis]
MIESKNAPSKLSIALSIGGLPFLLGARAAHGFIDAIQYATQLFVAFKCALHSKIHFW